MSFRVGALKNGWSLFRTHNRYYSPGEVSRGLSVYELYRDLINIDDIFDPVSDGASDRIISRSRILYSMLITIDLLDFITGVMPVKFEVGESFEHVLPRISHQVRKQPVIDFPRKNNIVINFRSYEELVNNYASLEHFIEWKKYEAAKIRFDRAGVQDFTICGEELLFPCERDLRKIILDEEERLKS